jgi:dihydrodipicolinate synthase/N-acetylneuraminate lyase
MSSSSLRANAIPAIRSHRTIVGMSAILLPMATPTEIDWIGFEQHLERTWQSGLTPAVNMDTGYANLIDDRTRSEGLQRARNLAAGRSYVAGVFVGDSAGAKFDARRYSQGISEVLRHGGTPIIFQSFGLTGLGDDELIDAYRSFGNECDRYLAFELGKMFAPFGRIYSLDLYRELLQIPSCYGAKHSSLDRQLEWERLAVRDQVRPDFLLLTGNDLAIDMVWYGSDYLLGLATFAPDYFAMRDRWWALGDPRAISLNDVLQYLGSFAFRPPVPAYKHSAAQFLRLRQWISADHVYPGSPVRPDTDIPILQNIFDRLREFSD